MARARRPRRKNRIKTTTTPCSQLSHLTLGVSAPCSLPVHISHDTATKLPPEILLNIVFQQLDDPEIFEFHATPRNMQALADFIPVRLVQSSRIYSIKHKWLRQRVDSLTPRINDYPVHEDLKSTRNELVLLFKTVRNVAVRDRDTAALEWTALMCEWCVDLMATTTSVMDNFKHRYGCWGGGGDLWEGVRIYIRHAKQGERYLYEGESLEATGAVRDLHARLPEHVRRWRPEPVEELVWGEA